MIPYTTPTLELTIDGVDLTGLTSYVTLVQGETALTIEDPPATYDGHRTTLAVTLTQAQTALFERGAADVQVNWLDAGGGRAATVVQTVRVGTQLLQEVKP